jgi:hypothetical protein
MEGLGTIAIAVVQSFGANYCMAMRKKCITREGWYVVKEEIVCSTIEQACHTICMTQIKKLHAYKRVLTLCMEAGTV